MSYETKYRIQYKRRSLGITTIDIMEKDYDESSAGAITPLLASGHPLEITFDGDVKNIFTPTLGSGAVIRVMAYPLTLIDLYTSDPQKFMVKIWDGQSGDVLRWQGFINTEIYTGQYSLNTRTEIAIYCNDGMKLLGDLKYKSNSSTFFTGKNIVADIFHNIVGKLATEYVTVYTSIDINVGVGYENLFAYLKLLNENFLDEQDEPMSCRDVLDAIVKSWSCVMRFLGPDIYIFDPINLHDTTKGKTYDYATFLTETVVAVGGYLDLTDTSVAPTGLYLYNSTNMINELQLSDT